MTRRVVITGMGFETAFGETWDENKSRIQSLENAVRFMPEWDDIEGLVTKLAAPCDCFKLPEHYTRKKVRSMSRVSLMATRASEIALLDSGLIDSDELKSGNTGVAYGSSFGSIYAVEDFSNILLNRNTGDMTANSYVKMMPQTAPVNISLFFGITGRIIPTSTACTSGSMAIGYAYEAIKNGQQTIMVAGGSEELSACDAAVFDTMYATSTLNDKPKLTPAPFDKDRDGLVIGEGAGTMVLEEYEHAKARGAKIYAEIIGFYTNCDATHITAPNPVTIEHCIASSVKDAGLSPSDIGYISAHGTGTARGDVAETTATFNVFGSKPYVSSLKSYFGHTLGACGAVEAIFAVNMMNEGWFNPNLNLKNVDPECGDLNYIKDDIKKLDVEVIQSNNFAFGGINTSLIIKRI
ncbi:MAG: beta-ketoacyl-ACP synthase [Succinivibrio sp.]